MTVDEVLVKLGGFGIFQAVFISCFIMTFSVGSQLFYSIPFYQLYPALVCREEHDDGTIELVENCSREYACELGNYSVDYSKHISLNNWMTELDLVCEPKIKIGLIGSL